MCTVLLNCACLKLSSKLVAYPLQDVATGPGFCWAFVIFLAISTFIVCHCFLHIFSLKHLLSAIFIPLNTCQNEKRCGHLNTFKVCIYQNYHHHVPRQVFVIMVRCLSSSPVSDQVCVVSCSCLCSCHLAKSCLPFSFPIMLASCY